MKLILILVTVSKKFYRKKDRDDFSVPKFIEKIKSTEAQSVYIWPALVYGVSQTSYLLMVDLMMNYTLKY